MWTDIVSVTGTPTNPPSNFDEHTVQSSDIGKLLVCEPTNNLKIIIPSGLPQAAVLAAMSANSTPVCPRPTPTAWGRVVLAVLPVAAMLAALVLRA